MKLHHVPGSRSCRVAWWFEEVGMDYESVAYTLGDPALRDQAYREKNPLGLVPTLEDGEVVLTESGAILQYLNERYGQGRLEPAVESAERPAYLRWFHFGEATLMLPLFDVMRHRFVLPEAQRNEAALANARKRLGRVLETLAPVVSGTQWILGDTFSAADIMVAYGLQLARQVGDLPSEPAAVVAYLDRASERPAFAKVFAGGFGG